MRYPKHIRIFMAALVLAGILFFSPAQAITVTVDPVTQDVLLGNHAIVDVIIYGYAPGEGVNIAVGAFDLNIAYDPLMLGFDSLVFGGSLGNPTTEAMVVFSNNSATGVLNIAEVSLLSAGELYALQGQEWPDDNFIAATLTFNTLSSGTIPLVIEINALANEMGGPFPDNYADPGSVNVGAVPEPTTILLYGLGFAGAGVYRRLRKKK